MMSTFDRLTHAEPGARGVFESSGRKRAPAYSPLAALAMAGCYSPSLPADCAILCGTESPCPVGMKCGPDSRCIREDSREVCPKCDPDGGYRCSGRDLEQCQPLSEEGWILVQRCASKCNADLGQCQICEPNTYRCALWRLEKCQNDGRGWQLEETCGSSELCVSDAGRCLPCTTGQAHCEGEVLHICNALGGWDREWCGSPSLCNATARSCLQCKPGRLDCNQRNRRECDHPLDCSQSELRRCTDESEWEHMQTCDTHALCLAALEQVQSGGPEAEVLCENPVCEADTFTCDGKMLLACAPGQDTWQKIHVADKRCVSGTVCDLVESECPEECDANEYFCEGNDLKQCHEDGKGTDLLGPSGCSAKTLRSCKSGLYEEKDCPRLCDDGADVARCVGCISDTDCDGSAPICYNNECRGAQAGPR
ncbi:hypothetical protein ACFL5O_11720 [Myxococcota bacterium]